MPTALPQPRRVVQKRSRARSAFDFLFNATLLVSGLILTYIVLVREEQYAFGRPTGPLPAIERTAYDGAIDRRGESPVIPPSN